MWKQNYSKIKQIPSAKGIGSLPNNKVNFKEPDTPSFDDKVSRNERQPFTLAQLAQRGDLEIDREIADGDYKNNVMKDFDFDEDNMMDDVMGGNSIMPFDSALKQNNISILKPLSKIYNNQQTNYPDLESKVSNLLDQGDMPNKKFSYIMESKSATQEPVSQYQKRKIMQDEVAIQMNEQFTNKRVTKQNLKENGAPSNDDVQSLKRRGRKRERDDLYFLKAEERIAKLKAQLKTAKADGLTVKERQRLRNQVSAQQSRIKRKGEAMYLNEIVQKKDNKFKELV